MASLHCAHSPSAARLFVQLSAHGSRRVTSPTPVSILDVLLPPPATRAFSAASTRSYARTRREQIPEVRRSRGLRREPPSSIPSQARRLFASSANLQATQAIYNPRKDEEGKDMLLDITPRAAKRLSEIMAKDSNPNLALRINVESGGCHGFQYLMKLVSLPGVPPPPAAQEAADPVLNEDDTIFAYTADEQANGDLSAPKIVLDEPSLELLRGSKVDFTMELIGSQFKIVDNPHATSSCGCGTSFDIKI